jgi:digeranylgeranylglycerophospholipid reductase
MKNDYDIIVVGAGPAGCMTAWQASLTGARVVLLEKDRDVGAPVRCAEGVSEKELRSIFPDPPPAWISQRITRAIIHAPSGAEIVIATDRTGFILNRKVFEFDLAQRAVAAGAELYTKAYVQALLHEDDRMAGVQVERLGQRYTLRAPLVIGADGVESRVGRWAGLDTRTRLKDIDSCAQVLAGPLDIDMDTVHFYFSQHLTPAGYAWVFPKGNGLANIGLGIAGDKAASIRPRQALQRFLQSHFPQARLFSFTCGGVPCTPAMKSFVTDGCMLVGDAAHQVNPMTGAGIITALQAGRLAGQIAGAAVRSGDVSSARLRAFEKQWRKEEGTRQDHYYRLKNFAFGLNDSQLDSLAEIILKLPFEKRTILNIFRHALFQKPSLLLDAMRVFT